MNRPDFDKMSDREQMQAKAYINEFLGQRMSLQKKRKQIMRETQKTETEQEKETKNAECK